MSDFRLVLGPQPTWMARAACAGLTTSPEDVAFFPTVGGSSVAAKAICNRCPVTQPCLDWALDNDEYFGVWGGLTAHERRPLQRQRKAAS